MILFGSPYTIREGVVFWATHPVPKADAASFRHLGGHWARDAEHIFAHGKIKKVDVSSFKYLNPVYAKDANAAYDAVGPIKGADPDSFDVLDSGMHVGDEIVTVISVSGYARDRNSVFYHDQGFGRATTLRGADPKSFVSLRNDFGFDSEHVWFQKSRLPKADPKTWVRLGVYWSADRERVFYAEREVPGINRDSFTIVAAPMLGVFATDCERFYMAEHQISEQEFWTEVAKTLHNYEKYLRVGYQRLRGNCSTCNGTGKCSCVHGLDASTFGSTCGYCNGTQECHVCQGGRVPGMRF